MPPFTVHYSTRVRVAKMSRAASWEVNPVPLWRFRRLRGPEAALPMGAVAERFILGLPAPAQGDGVFPRRNQEFIAQVIQNPNRSLNDQGAVFPTANGKRVRHDAPRLKRTRSEPAFGCMIGPVQRVVGFGFPFRRSSETSGETKTEPLPRLLSRAKVED